MYLDGSPSSSPPLPSPPSHLPETIQRGDKSTLSADSVCYRLPHKWTHLCESCEQRCVCTGYLCRHKHSQMSVGYVCHVSATTAGVEITYRSRTAGVGTDTTAGVGTATTAGVGTATTTGVGTDTTVRVTLSIQHPGQLGILKRSL